MKRRREVRSLIKPLVKLLFDRLGYRLVRKDRSPGDIFEDLRRACCASSVKVVLDGGASVGGTALKLRSLFPEARVYAFEPHRESFKRLSDVARTDPRIIPIRAALSSEEGRVVLHVTSHAPASALVAPTSKGLQYYPGHLEVSSIEEVDAYTIDGWRSKTGNDRVDLLKLDVQGYELHALRGAVDLLTSSPPKAVSAEVSFVRLYENACLYHEIDTFLRQYGYKLYKLYGLHMPNEGRLVQAEALYLRSTNPLLGNFPSAPS